MSDTSTHDYVESSGNVFADMNLEDADELLTRTQLGYSVRQILKERGLKQQDIATLLEIKQPEVSNLMQGKYHLFSEGRLFSFLRKLDRKVIIQISQHQEGSLFNRLR
ncbi:helix-turn-helix domain-containing protein [Altericista sp. CCNU0014]|uniref:helix-turn-helix domain-containing protein n=1 Tax=Altericista sp. CCNU0014 TaxID=3082949 RepID=UPI00384DF33A